MRVHPKLKSRSPVVDAPLCCLRHRWQFSNQRDHPTVFTEGSHSNAMAASFEQMRVRRKRKRVCAFVLAAVCKVHTRTTPPKPDENIFFMCWVILLPSVVGSGCGSSILSTLVPCADWKTSPRPFAAERCVENFRGEIIL